MAYDDISDAELIERANICDRHALRCLLAAAEGERDDPVKLATALRSAREANALRREYCSRTGEPAPANRPVLFEV